MKALPQWLRANNLQVDPHQRIVDRLNEVGQLVVGDGLGVQATPVGPIVNSTIRSVNALWEDWGLVVYRGAKRRTTA